MWLQKSNPFLTWCVCLLENTLCPKVLFGDMLLGPRAEKLQFTRSQICIDQTPMVILPH